MDTCQYSPTHDMIPKPSVVMALAEREHGAPSKEWLAQRQLPNPLTSSGAGAGENSKLKTRSVVPQIIGCFNHWGVFFDDA